VTGSVTVASVGLYRVCLTFRWRPTSHSRIWRYCSVWVDSRVSLDNDMEFYPHQVMSTGNRLQF